MSTALSVVSPGGRSAGLSHMGALTLEREDGEIIRIQYAQLLILNSVSKLSILPKTRGKRVGER